MSARLVETPLRVVGLGYPTTPALPTRDLDIGVIYTGERDLMLPLLSTMKASADRPPLSAVAGR